MKPVKTPNHWIFAVFQNFPRNIIIETKCFSSNFRFRFLISPMNRMLLQRRALNTKPELPTGENPKICKPVIRKIQIICNAQLNWGGFPHTFPASPPVHLTTGISLPASLSTDFIFIKFGVLFRKIFRFIFTIFQHSLLLFVLNQTGVKWIKVCYRWVMRNHNWKLRLPGGFICLERTLAN